MAHDYHNDRFKQARIKRVKPSKDGTPRFSRQRLLRALAVFGMALLLLIPTYIAVGNYLYRKSHPEQISEAVYSSLVITGPHGIPTTVELGESEENNTLLALISNLLAGATKIDSFPDGYSVNYVISAETNLGPEEYRFAFSTASAECYFIDKNGDYRHAAKEATEAFLNSPFAHELYPGSTAPVLVTATTEEITPLTLDWHYQTVNGTFADRAGIATTEETRVYPIANEIGFYFSVEPSRYTVTIKQGERTFVYEKNDTISLSALNEGEILECEIHAAYDNTAGCTYYGSATYRFHLKVVQAAKFTVDAPTKTVGDYFILSCKNINNMDKLLISAEPALATEPMRWQTGDTVFVAIPATKVGSHRLNIGYGTIVERLDVTVKEKSTAASHTATAELFSGSFIPALSGGIAEKLLQKGAAAVDTSLIPGSVFTSPEADGFSLLYRFGDTITVTDTDVENAALPFELYRGSGSIRATSFGIVKEVGNDTLLGRYVIVDHGCGLYTWYCGLEHVYVSVGMPIASGDTLGTAGTTGPALAGERSLLLMVTLGKEAIDPACLRNGGFLPQ